MTGPHIWQNSTLGHGTLQCKNCLMTWEEAWAIDLAHQCDKCPDVGQSDPALQPEPEPVPRAWMRRFAFEGNMGTRGNRPPHWQFRHVTIEQLFPDDVPLYFKPGQK